VGASEAEERAAWELWRLLRPGAGKIENFLNLDAALRELREAGWGEAEIARALEIGRAAAARPRGAVGRRGGELARAGRALRLALAAAEGD
jgi:hypothetical protein